MSSSAAPEVVWPQQAEVDPADILRAYLDVGAYADFPPEALDQVAVFAGHVPVAAVQELEQLLCEPLAVTTVLRDPVDRAVSQLKQASELYAEFQDQPLEAIYEDCEFRRRFLVNHQTKVLGMGEGQVAEADRPQEDPDAPEVEDALVVEGSEVVDSAAAVIESVVGSVSVETMIEAVNPGVVLDVPVDRTMLERAQGAVEDMELVGVTEHLDRYCADLANRFAWDDVAVPVTRVSPPFEVPDSLRRRLQEDNEFDLELYESVLDRLELPLGA